MVIVKEAISLVPRANSMEGFQNQNTNFELDSEFTGEPMQRSEPQDDVFKATCAGMAEEKQAFFWVCLRCNCRVLLQLK